MCCAHGVASNICMSVCCCKVAGRMLLQENLLDVSVKHQLQSEFYPRIKNITDSVNAMQNRVCMCYQSPLHC